MSVKIESLKRLYASGAITADEVNGLKTVAEEEKQEILSGAVNREQEYLGYLKDLGVDTSEA